jgi:hypothetical protein
LHAGAIIGIELRCPPPLRSWYAFGHGLVLATYVPRNAKVGKVNSVCLEENVGWFYIKMPDIVLVTVSHGTSNTANCVTQELKRAFCCRMKNLVFSRGLNGTQILDV